MSDLMGGGGTAAADEGQRAIMLQDTVQQVRDGFFKQARRQLEHAAAAGGGSASDVEQGQQQHATAISACLELGPHANDDGGSGGDDSDEEVGDAGGGGGQGGHHLLRGEHGIGIPELRASFCGSGASSSSAAASAAASMPAPWLAKLRASLREHASVYEGTGWPPTEEGLATFRSEAAAALGEARAEGWAAEVVADLEGRGVFAGLLARYGMAAAAAAAGQQC